MKRIGIPKLVAGAAMLAIAVGAISQTAPNHYFAVGVQNNTTTPAVTGNDGTVIVGEGVIQTECGGRWRTLENEDGKVVFFECFPGSATGAFDLTYKVRLSDGEHGARYHSGTVSIDCPRGSANTVDNATSAELTLTGSGTLITASGVTCNYPQADSDDLSSSTID